MGTVNILWALYINCSMRKIIMLFIVLLAYACENILVQEVPENTYLANFNHFWNDFDQFYAGFAVRKSN